MTQELTANYPKSLAVLAENRRDVKTSLADAKPAENPIEQVIGVDCAHHFSQGIERVAQFHSKEFRRILMQDDAVRVAQVFQAGIDMMPAPAQARRQRRLLLRTCALRDQSAKFLQADSAYCAAREQAWMPRLQV